MNSPISNDFKLFIILNAIVACTQGICVQFEDFRVIVIWEGLRRLYRAKRGYSLILFRNLRSSVPFFHRVFGNKDCLSGMSLGLGINNKKIGIRVYDYDYEVITFILLN